MRCESILIICCILLGVFMAGCVRNEGASSSVAGSDLLHHHFVLVSVDGKAAPMAGEQKPFLEFGEGFRVFGKICNNFNGQAVLKSGVLKADQVASTLMLCPDDSLNALETQFHQALQQGLKVQLQNTILTLRGEGHTYTYELKDLVQ